MSTRILVIDDDAELQATIAEVLEQAGFAVETEKSAEAALERLEKKEVFNIILLDLIMPGMGGMEALPLIKKACPKAKIIMITAFATVDNAVEAMKRGADDYISKPFKVNELLTTIMRSREEARFLECHTLLDLENTFSCLANGVRREIITDLAREGGMRFMDLARHLKIEDHTKVNFHLKVLREAGLVEQDRRKHYVLSREGRKIAECLTMVVKTLS
jgi:DNA-binding response OmpR family regulator